MYDLIIIGLGAAGISASIYAKRSNLHLLCLEKNMPGGIINYIDKIDNYPGFNEISGTDLSYKLNEHLTNLNIPYKLESVKKITKENDIFNVITKNNTYQAKKVIIASGRKARKLNLPNEEKFLGRGISYCAVCDGAFFKNTTVAVVGSGYSAAQEALYLSNFVYKINLLVRKDHLKIDTELLKKLESKKNIEILYNTKIDAINGNESLSSLTVTSLKENYSYELKVSGLFIYIGYEPNIEYLQEFPIFDKDGYIEVNDKYETKVTGLYAVGDNIKKDYYQIITAMAEGAVAALNVCESLN
ncbi:MAG: FAD-dependent oxidoreductase [bacterium]|nr:FAD-dependent oxidoreductase [bacterium]